MRLTQVLCKQLYLRMFQRVWKKQGQMQINELSIPPELQEMGVKIYDAKELFRSAEANIVPKKKGRPELFIPGPNITEEKKFYLLNQKTRLTEGLDQVLSLTKTVSYEGLPDVLENLVGQEEIPDQDQRVQDCIKQSLLWDSHQQKLAKEISAERPGGIYPLKWGAPLRRKVTRLLSKLVLLGESATGKFPESIRRSKVADRLSQLLINSGNDSVAFNMCSEILIADEKPLSPFAPATEVEATKMAQLPSLYPIKPTLDLDQYDFCPISNIISNKLPSSPRFLHTLHVPHRSIGFFFPVQKLARGIACCFSFAAEEAQRLHGPNVKELLDPVSVQCIYMDVKSFGFIAYQLNTLDLSNKEGVKNQVWIDGPYDLYEKVNTENGVVNYNPLVFSKMLAFYMNGLHPSCL